MKDLEYWNNQILNAIHSPFEKSENCDHQYIAIRQDKGKGSGFFKNICVICGYKEPITTFIGDHI